MSLGLVQASTHWIAHPFQTNLFTEADFRELLILSSVLSLLAIYYWTRNNQWCCIWSLQQKNLLTHIIIQVVERLGKILFKWKLSTSGILPWLHVFYLISSYWACSMCQIFQSLFKSRVNFKIPLTHLFLLFCFILLGLRKNKQTNKGFNRGHKDSHGSGDI